MGSGSGLVWGCGRGCGWEIRVRARFGVRRDRLGKGRAEDAAGFVIKDSLPADHVRYERQLAISTLIRFEIAPRSRTCLEAT